MGFAINTNNDAINTYKNLNAVQNSLSKSLERLSSGLRINQAGDDAAGLTIATQLGSQVSGLQQASRNAQDGVSLLQTADGGLSQAQSLLGRMRDLAVQAGNDSNSADARNAIKEEAGSLAAELGRLGDAINFNGRKLLNGDSSTLNFQVGAGSTTDSVIQFGVAANLSSIGTALGTGASATATTFTAAKLTDANTKTLVFTSGTATNSKSVSVPIAGLTSDTDYSAFAQKLNTNADFKANYVATVTRDTNGNANGVAFSANDGSVVQLDATSKGYFTGTPTQTTGTASTGISFDTNADSRAALAKIDDALSTVTTQRAKIGALENRFASAISTIATSVTNLTAAKSRITDVDMAQEMVSYTRANVLSQSGTAMLAQANSLPQLALKLLG